MNPAREVSIDNSSTKIKKLTEKNLAKLLI